MPAPRLPHVYFLMPAPIEIIDFLMPITSMPTPCAHWLRGAAAAMRSDESASRLCLCYIRERVACHAFARVWLLMLLECLPPPPSTLSPPATLFRCDVLLIFHYADTLLLRRDA